MDERTKTETKIRKMNTFATGSLPVHFSVAKLFNFRWQYTTSGIQLSEDLNVLAESIAENVHEVWSEHRMAEGWTYGPVRNDKRKTHPCLVPYKDLPESEKEYDRNTSRETLKMIVSLGFDIKKEDNR